MLDPQPSETSAKSADHFFNATRDLGLSLQIAELKFRAEI